MSISIAIIRNNKGRLLPQEEDVIAHTIELLCIKHDCCEFFVDNTDSELYQYCQAVIDKLKECYNINLHYLFNNTHFDIHVIINHKLNKTLSQKYYHEV